ncbi:MAG: class I SAM-dependent methyltransferase [Patescibacteria group bacterium]
MAQYKAWEKEYRDSKLVTKYSEPQKFILRFFKYLKKSEGIVLKNLNVLDLGSGTGRNANYLAQEGSRVVGIEISNTAIDIAKKRAKQLNIGVKYLPGNIGEHFPLNDKSIDLVLDATSSNSLNARERDIYLDEVNRVLRSGGYFFVRALCRDGDKNAKKLIKINPGMEKDTYVMPEVELIERVWTRTDFVDYYSKYFKIIKLVKEISYTRFNNRRYKRNFWVAYLRKE